MAPGSRYRLWDVVSERVQLRIHGVVPPLRTYSNENDGVLGAGEIVPVVELATKLTYPLYITCTALNNTGLLARLTTGEVCCPEVASVVEMVNDPETIEDGLMFPAISRRHQDFCRTGCASTGEGDSRDASTSFSG